VRAAVRLSPLRRRAWLACTWLVLVVLAAPAALGPATGPMLRELGVAMTEHVCKCGMPAGKCGCPECERLEHLLASGRRTAEGTSLIKPQCDDDAPLVRFAALPSAVIAATRAVRLPVPAADGVRFYASASLLTRPADRPPTPPPRLATA
jgi:hypothetical protein